MRAPFCAVPLTTATDRPLCRFASDFCLFTSCAELNDPEGPRFSDMVVAEEVFGPQGISRRVEVARSLEEFVDSGLAEELVGWPKWTGRDVVVCLVYRGMNFFLAGDVT